MAHAFFVAGGALVLILLSCTSTFSGTLLVDDDKAECPGAGFQTIQGAVDAATAGDVIQVCPGTYDEQVVIAKPLTLVGIAVGGKKAAVGAALNMIANTDFNGSPQASAILVKDTSGVNINNITVDGINNGIVWRSTPPFIDGIFFRNAAGTVQSVVIEESADAERVRLWGWI